MTNRFLWVLLCVALSTWGCATDEDSQDGEDTGSGGITGNQDGGEPDMAAPDMAMPDMAAPDAAVPECVEDADCAERGEVCLDNVCVPPPPQCEGPQDCGDEQACEDGVCVDMPLGCVADEECEPGLVCAEGQCVDGPPAGCMDDEECPEGVCGEDGVCIAIDPECGDDADCEEGMICSDEFICVLPCQPGGEPLAIAIADVCIDNCPGGLVCDDACGACVEAPMGLCEVDADCPEGTICQEGACVDGPPMGCEDIGCPSGLFCENGECVDGPPIGCEVDDDCPADLSCFEGGCLPIDPECRADADCEEGFFCIEGACSPNFEPECQANEDCAEGEACVEGICEPDEPGECVENVDCGGLICVEGVCGLCEVDEQCDPGFMCLQGICIPPQGEDCQADEDCGPGGICFDGSCEPGEPGECQANADCAEGEECLNNSCFPEGANMCVEAIVFAPPNAMGTYDDAFPVHTGLCGGDGPEVIFEYTSAVETIICLDTFGSLGDTVLYVRNICGDAFSEVACNDDSDNAEDLESQVQFLAEAGVTYSIFVDSYEAGAEDDFTLNFAEGPCPGEPIGGRECDENFDCPDEAECIEGICEFLE